jgi:hypothetical protein
MSQSHSAFLVEQVARIIHYYVEPDPRLITLSMDDDWIALTEQQKEPWYAKATEWLDTLFANYPASYAQLAGGITAPREKFW